MEDTFRKHLKGRKLDPEEIDFSISAVREFGQYLKKEKLSFESAGLSALKEYISLLMEEGKNSMERLVAIARYCNLVKKNDYFTYLVAILGARNVLPDMGERLAEIAGDEIRGQIFPGVPN